jgi:hypothetical protein
MKPTIALPLILLFGCTSDELDVAERDAPCDNLLDRLTTPTGSTVEFCALEDGSVAVLERAPLTLHGYVKELERYWRCPSDLYADLAAPGTAVPLELEEDCRRRTEAGRVPVAIEARPPLAPPSASYRSHFCAGSSGDNDFVDEVCFLMEANAADGVWYDSMWWCNAVPFSSSQRTASSQLGHNADKVRAAIASCDGTSNLRLRWKNGGSWSTQVDTDVLSGFWLDAWLYTAQIDKDLRFNAEAYGDAWYRNTGMFGDFEWP